MIRGHAFVEWAVVHGAHYGTSRKELAEGEGRGRDPGHRRPGSAAGPGQGPGGRFHLHPAAELRDPPRPPSRARARRSGGGRRAGSRRRDRRRGSAGASTTSSSTTTSTRPPTSLRRSSSATGRGGPPGRRMSGASWRASGGGKRAMKTIALGVSSSISIYKACEVLRGFQKKEVQVQVVMTPNAAGLIHPRLFSSLSGRTAAVELFGGEAADRVAHIALAGEISLLVVAPATANVIAKFASGIADDYPVDPLSGGPLPGPRRPGHERRDVSPSADPGEHPEARRRGRRVRPAGKGLSRLP